MAKSSTISPDATALELYYGSCEGLIELACSTECGVVVGSRAEITVNTGDQIYIRIGSRYGGQGQMEFYTYICK